jgi:hypothetical protein
MTKSKQTQMVSNFLSEKQLKSIKMVNDYGKKQCGFTCTYIDKKTGEEHFSTNTGGDDVEFSLRIDTLKKTNFTYLNFTLGGFTIYCEHKFFMSDEVGDNEMEVIKFLIKNFTDNIGNSIYVK